MDTRDTFVDILDTIVDTLDTIVDKVYKVLGILDTTVDSVYRVLDMLDTFMDTDDTESWTFWTQRLCKIVDCGKPPYICDVQNLHQAELMWMYTIMDTDDRKFGNLGLVLILDQLGKFDS